jgi:tetratricopeptide (TPR) repeat protein
VKRFVFLVVCGLAATSGMAQKHAAARPTILLPGMGHHTHPITAANAEAQKFFDQGLTLLYGFNHDEAIRSFQHAAELDPASSMPHWGIALAMGPNYNLPDVDRDAVKAAHAEVENARGLAAHGSPRERAYIDALARRYSADSNADLTQLGNGYSAAMRSLSERYPDDLDAATLYAESLMNLRPWQLWNANGTPAPETEEIMSVLESVLRRNPDHPGANHYYIHTVEASRHPEWALPSARRLLTLVPGAGHLMHMPAHIYYQLGDYETTAETNERAARADEEYMRLTRTTRGVYPWMYYSHNLHFIAFARAEQGRFEQARQAAEKLAAHVAPGVTQMDMLQQYVAVPYTVGLRTEQWDYVLSRPPPGDEAPYAKAIAHYARAMAHAAHGKKENALQEQREFLATWKSFPADRVQLEYTTADDLLKVAAAVLEARLADNAEAALALWHRAVEIHDGVNYGEPPPWYFPVHEALGAALLRAGRPVEAEKVFRDDLTRHPRSPRSLFGLWHALETQGEADEAGLVRRQFEAVWKNTSRKLRLEDL